MFGFFRKRQPIDPPTDKQRDYARRIGIEVPPTMGKAELSEAIASAERNNPALIRRREGAKAKAREAKYGKELADQEDRWNRFADEIGYMVAVYTRGKETIVDVLRVNGAFVTERGKLRLEVESPKVAKDRHIGTYIEWEQYFELPIESLRHHEPLHSDFHNDGNDAYRRAVERGLAVARRL